MELIGAAPNSRRPQPATGEATGSRRCGRSDLITRRTVTSTFVGLRCGHSMNKRFDLVHDQVDRVGAQGRRLESPTVPAYGGHPWTPRSMHIWGQSATSPQSRNLWVLSSRIHPVSVDTSMSWATRWWEMPRRYPASRSGTPISTSSVAAFVVALTDAACAAASRPRSSMARWRS